MRKLQSVIFITFIIVVILSSKSHAKCITSWEYYQPITVSNNTSSALSNYQVKVIVNTASLISAGKMTVNGNDIRFVDPGTCNNLNYWIESGINTSSTVIWVKLNLLSANGNEVINMYYGNPSATAASNGDSTFIIFDDFNASSLNTSKWTAATSGSNASVSLSGGTLVCSTSGEANIHSKSAFPSPLIEEANISAVSGSFESMAILNANSDNGYGMWMADYNYSDGTNSGPNTMWTGWIFTPNNPQCVYYTGHFTDSTSKPGTLTGIWKLEWPTSNIQYMNWPGGSFTTTNTQWTLSSNVQIAIGNMCGATGSISVDWIRARSYSSTEPTISEGQEVINHNSSIDNQNPVDHISIYPNPVRDMLNIDFSNSNLHFKNLQWVDENGKLMRTINIEGKTGIIELSTSGIAKGIYFIKLSGDGETVVQKVTLE